MSTDLEAGRTKWRRQRIAELESALHKLRLEELAHNYGGMAPDAVLKECRALVKKHRTVEAIKLYRSKFGSGLCEAKDAVERLR